jgi:hypothetical protein
MSVALCLLLIAAAAFAQPQQSAHFQNTKLVIDAGGGLSASPSFHLAGAVGQPVADGWQSSSHFRLSSGHFSPQFAPSPLSPIHELVIQFNDPDIDLHWERVPSATAYAIYRDTTAVFAPGPTNQIGIAPDTLFHDLNAMALPAMRYFYAVTSEIIPPSAMKQSPSIAPDLIGKTNSIPASKNR